MEINPRVRDDVFKAAVHQLQADRPPDLTNPAEMARQLLSEALEALTDNDSEVDLRQWARATRAFLEGAGDA